MTDSILAATTSGLPVLYGSPKLASPSPAQMLWKLLLSEHELGEVHELPRLDLLWPEVCVLGWKLVDECGMAAEQRGQRVVHLLPPLVEGPAGEVPEVSWVNVELLSALLRGLKIKLNVRGQNVRTWEEGRGWKVEQNSRIGVELKHHTGNAILLVVRPGYDALRHLFLHSHSRSTQRTGVICK